MAEKPERDERSATDAPERGIEDRLATALLPGFVRRRYAVKFLLTLLVVAVVVASFGVYTYVEVRSVTQADAETTLRSTATIQADNVAEWLSGMRSRTLAAASSDVYADNASRVRSYLRDVGSEPGGDVLAIHYVDGTGRIAVSTARELEGLYPSAVSPGLATPLETVTAGSKTVGVSTAFERRGELRMAFATPVRTGDGVAIVGDPVCGSLYGVFTATADGTATADDSVR